MSQAAAEITSTIDYLIPTSRINRRFWAPGEEYNTGVNRPYPVTIRNARLAGPFTLDDHGFCLGRHATDVTDWEYGCGPDSPYAAQVSEVAKRLSGADVVIPMSRQIRTSARLGAARTPRSAT